MSVSERRRKYRYDRILIESARILSPQFNSAFLYVTGAQVELLRNVAAYLRRLETYVSEYHPGYYLTPTVADYDELLAIVADLEGILMAADNAPWKITDHLGISEANYNAADGYNYLSFSGVPADEIWVVEAVHARDNNTTIDRISVMADVNTQITQIHKHVNPTAAEYHSWQGHLTLQEGDYIQVDFYGCVVGDDLAARIIGYIMTVPE